MPRPDKSWWAHTEYGWNPQQLPGSHRQARNAGTCTAGAHAIATQPAFASMLSQQRTEALLDAARSGMAIRWPKLWRLPDSAQCCTRARARAHGTWREQRGSARRTEMQVPFYVGRQQLSSPPAAVCAQPRAPLQAPALCRPRLAAQPSPAAVTAPEPAAQLLPSLPVSCRWVGAQPPTPTPAPPSPRCHRIITARPPAPGLPRLHQQRSPVPDAHPA